MPRPVKVDTNMVDDDYEKQRVQFLKDEALVKEREKDEAKEINEAKYLEEGTRWGTVVEYPVENEHKTIYCCPDDESSNSHEYEIVIEKGDFDTQIDDFETDEVDKYDEEEENQGTKLEEKEDKSEEKEESKGIKESKGKYSELEEGKKVKGKNSKTKDTKSDKRGDKGEGKEIVKKVKNTSKYQQKEIASIKKSIISETSKNVAKGEPLQKVKVSATNMKKLTNKAVKSVDLMNKTNLAEKKLRYGKKK